MIPVKVTTRQKQCAVLATKGYTNAQIGHALGIAEETVKTHLRELFDKADIKSRAQLWMVVQNLGEGK